MLPFKNRLVKRKEFAEIQRNGQFFSEGNVAIKVLENTFGETRIGFVVGIKYSKKAVERNMVKRQLRESFQLNLKKIKKGFDVVVMLRKRDGERVKFKKLEQDIVVVLNKSNLISGNN